MGAEVLELQAMQRPTRGQGGRDYGSRNTIVGTEAIRLSLTEGSLSDVEESVQYNAAENAIPKTEAEVKWIKEIVKGNFLFSHLDEAKVRIAKYSFQKRRVSSKHYVIPTRFWK
jgi:hypothetical protein